ncbi:hypothetical protein G4B88_023420 [Cannabis sativa]|uniref:Coenzyme Q-binding protein COQ10 START domain-containing protein n=1 Tax=Cannabis sativa TaxID=3483 RepID=A0A7J6DPI9_CANSA|nr:hypothetical protein G4B88_023420 [Cannabis sativa]
MIVKVRFLRQTTLDTGNLLAYLLACHIIHIPDYTSWHGTTFSQASHQLLSLLRIRYSPEQLYNVVAAVDLYHDFLPWCQRSDILKQYPDGSFDAELEIGFKFFVESYVSHVELVKPKRIKTTASDTTLFDHLINIWEFNPGPVPGSCSVYFLVDFKFQSPLYRQVASMFFKDVVSRLVGSFNERCRIIYGPAARVLENSYEHGV